MSRLKYFFVVIFFLVFFSFLVYASEENLKSNSNDSIKVIVKFNSSRSAFGVHSFFAERNSVQETLDRYKDYELREVSLEELELLKQDSSFEVVIPSREIHAFLEESVPLINASSVWSIEIGGVNLTGVNETICVLDTGIDFSHEALIGKNKTCVVDCYNKVCVENCSVGDDNGHGTHVAGIAAASTYIDGVAIGANLIGLKVLNSAGSGSGNDFDLSRAIDWCVEHKEEYNISVISMSLGTSNLYEDYCDIASDPWTISINNATFYNISVIAASGNDANYTAISAPACMRNSTAVVDTYDGNVGGLAWGSPVVCTDFTTAVDKFVCHGNRNSLVDLVAPGALINSTWNDGGYQEEGGTSMATPHVAGAFALLHEFLLFQNKREPLPFEIQVILNNSGKLISDSETGLNFSRINVYSALIFADSTNPVVSLVSPGDNTYNFSQNITFECQANDVLLSNISLYLWNETDVYNVTTYDVSGTNVYAQFNLTDIAYGSYEWNCLSYDNNTNFSFASSNYSLVIEEIFTQINSPSNNTFTNSDEQFFNCSVQTSSTKEISNITFSVYNQTDLLYNDTQDVGGISNSSVFSYNLTNETVYYWNCESSNNVSDKSISSNYSLTYDVTSPNITLVEPYPVSETSSSVSKVFYYNVTDNYNVNNCSLIINNVISLTNSSINLTSTNNFTNTFTPGTYVWKINCTDFAGNIENSLSQSFTITTPTVYSGGGGGGGSGGGGSSSLTYSVPLEEGNKGYTKSLRKNDKIKFVFQNQEEHTITANNIGVDYLNLTVQSEPIVFVIYSGEEVKLNLTDSDFYNLKIKLNNIVSQSANLTIQTIYEKISKSQEEEFIENVSGESLEDEPVDNMRFMERFRECFSFLVEKLIFYQKYLIIMLIIIVILILSLMPISYNESSKTKCPREQKISFCKWKEFRTKY